MRWERFWKAVHNFEPGTKPFPSLRAGCCILIIWVLLSVFFVLSPALSSLSPHGNLNSDWCFWRKILILTTWWVFSTSGIKKKCLSFVSLCGWRELLNHSDENFSLGQWETDSDISHDQPFQAIYYDVFGGIRKKRRNNWRVVDSASGCCFLGWTHLISSD